MTSMLEEYRAVRTFLAAHGMDQSIPFTISIDQRAYLSELAVEWRDEQARLAAEARELSESEPPESKLARDAEAVEAERKEAEEILYYSSGGGE